ncbi:hypothetical protein Nepgr_031780 [Nepenthes gracilis]|uniref:Uncharacterized protein n=1 Tax=Nepenthes gracilis TaxID=150966 RepID=A0AAD3Y546_NEPGR|nr:hypothetical protein Nepgr_031780 [Nepenthes gracilis]
MHFNPCQCAVAVMDVVSSGMPTEVAVEEAPVVDSTPSPHDAHYVHRDMAPDVDSAFAPRLPNSVPDETSPGREAAAQDVKLLGVVVPHSCPQGPSVGWTNDEPFAKQSFGRIVLLLVDDAIEIVGRMRMPPEACCCLARGGLSACLPVIVICCLKANSLLPMLISWKLLQKFVKGRDASNSRGVYFARDALGCVDCIMAVYLSIRGLLLGDAVIDQPVERC